MRIFDRQQWLEKEAEESSEHWLCSVSLPGCVPLYQNSVKKYGVWSRLKGEKWNEQHLTPLSRNRGKEGWEQAYVGNLPTQCWYQISLIQSSWIPGERDSKAEMWLEEVYWGELFGRTPVREGGKQGNRTVRSNVKGGPLLSSNGALKVWWSFRVVLNQDQGPRPLYPLTDSQ